MQGNRTNHHRGSANPQAKLTESKVATIRRLRKRGWTFSKAIADSAVAVVKLGALEAEQLRALLRKHDIQVPGEPEVRA